MPPNSSSLANDFDRSLRDLSAKLPDEPLPLDLRSRILDRLPESAPVRSPKERRERALRNAGAMAMVLVLLGVFAWLFTPLVISLMTDPAAEAIEAVKDANTWHIYGWEIQNKKKVAWEVWGRRKPFFYYERLGDRITYDDGRQRVEIIPPAEYYPPNPGVVIKTISQPKGINDGQDLSKMFSGPSASMKPIRRTSHDLVYQTFDSGGDFLGTGLFGVGVVTHNLYFVDRRTHDPDRMQEWMSMFDKAPLTLVQDVAVELNKPIPQGIAAPVAPAGYPVFDATAPLTSPDLPRENSVTEDGLTAQATAVSMDEAGDVLVRVRGWFGNTRLTSALPIQLQSGMPLSEWALPRSRWPYYDDRDRDYVLVSWPMSAAIPGPTGDGYLLFAPATPLAPGERLPQKLTVSLRVSAMLYYPLLSRDMTWSLALPAPANHLDFDRYFGEVDPNWRKGWIGHIKATFPAGVDDSRAQYWGWQQGPFRTNPKAFVTGVKWRERAVADSVSASNQAQFYRLNLADDYEHLREYGRERQVLQTVVAVSRQYPQTWSYYGVQAEAGLKSTDHSRVNSSP